MPKFFRESRAPRGAFDKLRNPRLYGDRDEQIEGRSLQSRSLPDPESAVIYRRRSKASYRSVPVETMLSDCTPREHERHVAVAQHNFDVLVKQVQAARERGDEAERVRLAALARERRATLLELTGGVERRAIEVDQGSAVNPMVAV